MKVENTINQQIENIINEHWSFIKKIFQENIGSIVLEEVKDDKTMKTLIITIYKQLPLPVRLIIKKDIFVQYCLENRDRLFGNTQEPVLET